MATIILGLDGMNLALLELCRKEMPHLLGILSKSAYASAESVFPLLSGPAWTSILTGQNVSRHGFLNSYYYDEQMHVRITNPEDIPSEHLYETISRFGKKIFVMDVPFSTPRRISGDFLDSYYSTKEKKDQIVPADLVKRFSSIQNYLNYKPKIKNVTKNILGFIEIINNNGQIIKDVIKSKRYEFMFFQLSVVDWVQHKALIKIKHRPKSKRARAARKVLKEVDNLIGLIIAHLSPEDYLFIISDHGGTELQGTFFINSWLKKENFLLPAKKKSENNHDDGHHSKFTFFHLGDIFQNVPVALAKIIKSNRFLLNLAKPIHRRMRSPAQKDISSEEQIDYQKSSAICLIKNIPIIKILGQDPVKKEKIKQEIISRLDADLAFASKDIIDYYHCQGSSMEMNQRLRQFGDIVVDLKDYELDVFVGNKVFLPGKTMFHDKNSLFIGYGPAIRIGKIVQDISILDINPTILYLLGIHDQQGKDGKVMDIFKEGFIPPVLQPPKSKDSDLEKINW